MKKKTFKDDKNKYMNIFPVDINKRIIDIYKYTNCIVQGRTLYYPNIVLIPEFDKYAINPILEQTMSLKHSSSNDEADNELWCNSLEPSTIKVCKNSVFYFIYNTDNYYHFIYDTLPYLISFFELKKRVPELKLLMQYPNINKDTMYPFILQFLELLNISYTNDVIIVEPCTIYTEIYISTSYTHDDDSNLPPRQEIFSFYQNLVTMAKNRCVNDSINTPQKMYISRRTYIHNDTSNIGTDYTQRRKMVNEDDLVEELCQNQGYVEVFSEKLSVNEKILFFSNATHIIGSIGGGIANVLFSKPTTKLIAIISPLFLDINFRFKYCLECVTVEYDYNTHHTEMSLYKKYMRVNILKTCDDKEKHSIGEIVDVSESNVTVAYSDDSKIGWNATGVYNIGVLSFDEISPIDYGLNSEYIYYFKK